MTSLVWRYRAVDASRKRAGGRVLVDDSLSMRRLVDKMLERGHYHDTTATNGQEALDILPLDPNDDGVLTDLELPCMNGYEHERLSAVSEGLLRRLDSLLSGPRTPQTS